MILTKFWRESMSAEKCRNRFERGFCTHTPNHPKNFEFVLEREAIARLRFDGGRSILQKPARALFLKRKQVIFGRGPCRPHRCFDSPATLCNLLVSLAACARLKILESISGKNEMGMRVDKSRQNDATASINDFGVALTKLFDLRSFSDVRDFAVSRKQTAVMNNS